jgi:imidazolonepropionase
MSSIESFPDHVDALWVNVHLATMTGGVPYGTIENGVLAVSGEKIVWVGKREELPPNVASISKEIHDGRGGWITPGLVDCHTHLVYGGTRAREFELRLQGETYEEIARRGGGIRSTVLATRGADEETLFGQSAVRLASLLEEGVTTVEIKSGYGLDLDTELRILRVARRLGERFPVTVIPTYLGAHALPREFEGRPDAYIDFVCGRVIPQVAAQGLAQVVDAFCERIGFSTVQTERVFKAAKAHGLSVKIHAEQLSDQGGALLAAEYGALSADHLEYVSENGVKAMAAKSIVAVLLPGASYFIRERRIPPVASLRRHNIPMAVATDCNPGTSPTTSILLMLNMACTLFGLTPEEALAGVTIHAARALGLHRRIGTLEPGTDADFVLWEISEPSELAYHLGFNPCREVIRHGIRVRSRKPHIPAFQDFQTRNTGS